MTAAGESAVAGVLRGLPEAQGVLCGSIVSGLRMQPGNWAGAYACWGTENREAAVRFVKGGPGTPHGGNVEVKVVDPSANPYLASAAILGLALDGIHAQARHCRRKRRSTRPSSPISDRERAGIVRLPEAQAEAIAALDNSQLVRGILGDPAVDMVVAVRRHGAGALRRPAAPSSWRTSSGWPGACEVPAERFLRAGATHRRSGADRPACARVLVDGGGPAPVRERTQRGQHRTAGRLRLRVRFATRLRRQRPTAAPILGLPKHVDPQHYWERRSQFTEAELARLVPAGRRSVATGWWTPASAPT